MVMTAAILRALAVILLTGAHGMPITVLQMEQDMAWGAFMQRFNKTYSSIEEQLKRYQIFQREVNLTSGDATLGITKFSDLTPDEFHARYLGRTGPARSATVPDVWDGTCYACKRFPELNTTTVPKSFDWTDKGAVTGIKTQHCGDCYAFSTTGDIEGVHYLAGNTLTSLSEEQIVDCCFQDESILKCAGCAGGNPEDVMAWLVKKGGIESEAAYPYTIPSGKRSHPGHCSITGKTPKNKVSAQISGWYQVSKSAAEEANILKQLYQVGPISVSIDATDSKMKQYTGGVANPIGCKPGQRLDHAVLVVGYGSDDGQDYWKIKNSWGEDWGENGYYRIVRGQNKCGLAEDVVHAKPL